MQTRFFWCVLSWIIFAVTLYESWSPTYVSLTLGVIPIVGSIALRVWAQLALGRHWRLTGLGAAHELVTTGPYRLCRNPIYMSVLLLFFGLAVIGRSLWAQLALFLGTLPAYILRVQREEEVLTRRFQDAYLHYRSVTPKFLPKLPRR